MKQILYFSAEWCGPCKSFKPLMERLSNELPIKFIDVDMDPSLTTQYGIRSVPTTVIVNNGVEVTRKVGALTESQVRELYNLL